jgi:FixJ family two-component response regulator
VGTPPAESRAAFAAPPHQVPLPTPSLTSLSDRKQSRNASQIQTGENRLPAADPKSTNQEKTHVECLGALAALTAFIAHEVNQRLSGSLANATSCLSVALFTFARDVLASSRPISSSCLAVDVGLAGITELKLQQQLTVRAMDAGALDFLTGIFAPDGLLHATEIALQLSRTYREEEPGLQALRARYQTLSHREQEVMSFVVCGLLNKQVSGQLCISEITVKQHRGRVMRKMCARSLPELVTMAIRLGLKTAGSS